MQPKPQGGVDLNADLSAEEIQMMQAMGIPFSFDTTHGKHVSGWGPPALLSLNGVCLRPASDASTEFAAASASESVALLYCAFVLHVHHEKCALSACACVQALVILYTRLPMCT